ncbi:hypothetical protein [Saccharopolyspora sp. 5N708]|uniref:hypothetical protein n=1 Tax=Saccharopolyspora sp. 5N708 TaxID=3457424 RepID=UPI003FD3917C
MHPRASVAGGPPQTDPQQYQQWDREVAESLRAAFGAATGRQVAAAYRQAFPPGYRDDSPVPQAVEDIAIMEGHPDQSRLGRVYRAPNQPLGGVRLRICWPDAAPLLQEVLPIFAGLGLRVADHRSYEVHPAGRPAARVDDFGLLHDLDELTDTSARLVEDAFAAMWTGRAERDGFNRLVLTAGLPWRQAALVRAAYHYLWQAGFTFSRPYVEATLAGRPRFVRALLGSRTGEVAYSTVASSP